MPTDGANDQDTSRPDDGRLLRTYAEVVTPEIARELAAAGGPHPEGRLLGDVLDETGGSYVFDGDIPDRVMAGLRRHVNEVDDPAARRILQTGRLVIPFEHLRGLDPATTRIRIGFSVGTPL